MDNFYNRRPAQYVRCQSSYNKIWKFYVYTNCSQLSPLYDENIFLLQLDFHFIWYTAHNWYIHVDKCFSKIDFKKLFKFEFKIQFFINFHALKNDRIYFPQLILLKTIKKRISHSISSWFYHDYCFFYTPYDLF